MGGFLALGGGDLRVAKFFRRKVVSCSGLSGLRSTYGCVLPGVTQYTREELKEGEIYFGLRFQKFQSVVSWVCDQVIT